MKITVFDCDPGIDDSFALFLISRLKINVDYFIATFGNDKQEITSRNLEIMSEYLSLDGELVNGCSCALDGSIPECGAFHGQDGLADIADEMMAKYPPRKRAVSDYKSLEEKLLECDEIIYYAVGPLTTLATIIENSEIKNKIKNVFVMGGGLNRFNKDFNTEYNFFSDGNAVKKVFESGINITIFPLDLTMITGVKKDVIDELESRKTFSEMITMLRYNYNKNLSFGNNFAVLHDTLPVLYSIYPNEFTVEEMLLSADGYGHIEKSKNGHRIMVATKMQDNLLNDCLKNFFI